MKYFYSAITTLALSFIYFTFSNAHGQNLQWAFSIGGNYGDYGTGLFTDKFGNVFITGSFYQDTVDFDPDSDTVNHISTSGFDIFFAKYDANGNYTFSKSLSSTGNNQAYCIYVDSLGYIYITGYFWGSVDFDPGPDSAILSNTNTWCDIFFAKYDSLGNYIFAKQEGGIIYTTWYDNTDIGFSITVDNIGNIYLAGRYSVPCYNSYANHNIFFSKYDNYGNKIYLKILGSCGEDEATSIICDNFGNAYITGSFRDSVDFDPDTLSEVYLKSGNSVEMFIAKYDSIGNYVFAIATNSSQCNSRDIALDKNGNIYNTGYFVQSCDFDPGTDTAILFSSGSTDIYIAKYDNNGNYLWAKGMGGSGIESGASVFIDDYDNIYLTGYFSDTVDFDTGTETRYQISTGNADGFIVKYDTNGFYLYGLSFGGANVDAPTAISVLDSNYIYIIGHFNDTADFDPGLNTYYLYSHSQNQADIFLAKYSSPCIYANILFSNPLCKYDDNGYATISISNGTSPFTYLWSTGDDSVSISNLISGTYSVTVTDSTGCIYADWITLSEPPLIYDSTSILICDGDSVFLQGKYQTISGIYYDTLQAINGCDSIVEISLSILQISNSTLYEAACNSYTLNSQVYTASGTYTQMLTNATGCDSTITLNLTIKQSLGNSQLVASCSGDSIFIGGNYQTTAGTYYDTLSSINSCDSIIATTLTINPLPTIPTISANGTILTSNFTAGNQWYLNDTIISGATSQNYSVTQNGNYTVEVTDTNSCSATSLPYNFTSIGIDQLTNGNSIVIIPNPSNGQFLIQLDKLQGIKIQIFNIIGEIVYESENENSETDLSKHPKGIYSIVMSTKGKSYNKKLIIQ